VLAESRLLPTPIPASMGERDLAALREVNVSMGLMLETVSERLLTAGGRPSPGPDKVAGAAACGRSRWPASLAFPFTTGLLIGIGETRASAPTR